MSLSDEEIKHLEELARIRLEDRERDKFRHQLSDIIDFVHKLQEADTSSCSETSCTARPASELRESEPGGELDHEEVMEQAPGRDGKYFRVPPVIERGNS